MKKFLLVVFFFALLAGALSAQEMNLHEVIVRSARAVEDVLPQGAMVAVLNFASTSETFSDYVIEELTGELVTGQKVTIVDRRNLMFITQEMNLQLSGDISDESAQAVGRMLGAQSIVSGTLTDMGTFHRFRIMVISVETAAIQTQVAFNLRNDAQVAFLLGDRTVSFPPVAQQESARQSAQRFPRTYLGGGLGFGGTFWKKYIRGDGRVFEEESGSYILPFFSADFFVTNFLAIGTIVGLGFGIEHNYDLRAVLLPILVKLRGTFGPIELTGNVGYTIELGFSLGATLGVNIGPGILFTEFLSIPWGVGHLDSAYFVYAGYKIGVGRNRR